jgi:hypothetical protein
MGTNSRWPHGLLERGHKYVIFSGSESEMENVATYSEARSEYTKQLATFIVPSLVQWFQALWARNAGDRQRCLSLFQSECEEVGRWNQDRIHDEVRVLIERSGCDYMEELMTAVFIAHTKVLTAVRLSTKQKKLSIIVPKLDHFIHRIFRESARTFWKSPFLFMDSGNVMERQKNILQVEALASDAITTAVRGLLPVKQILRDYMEDDQEEIEDEVVPAAAAAEEHKEPETEAAPAPVPEPAVPTLTVSDVSDSAAPAVVKIDTEPAVQFSDYDDVYDEKKGAPEMRYTPKEGMGEDADEDDLAEMASDGILEVDENSTKPLGDDDAEDLEAPVAPKVVPPPARVPTPDKIGEDEIEVLE